MNAWPLEELSRYSDGGLKGHLYRLTLLSVDQCIMTFVEIRFRCRYLLKGCHCTSVLGSQFPSVSLKTEDAVERARSDIVVPVLYFVRDRCSTGDLLLHEDWYWNSVPVILNSLAQKVRMTFSADRDQKERGRQPTHTKMD